MKMSFRWFGEEDKVMLRDISQILGVSGVVYLNGL
ncbi:mannonate dehydratase [Metabacillus litoralis]|nr:mannonate dehydratase [Metabacillus litoralis]MCM3652596.1 mannonate dehydratase [Metabacillus litoralis]